MEDRTLWVVKKDEETNEKYGHYPHERPIEEHIKNGIIILDKPSGPTSHQVAAWVKEILGAKKVGHSGTLDPHVTGVLPTTIDNATKIIPVLLNSGKEYVAIMRLHKEVDENQIRTVMNDFVGIITQMPPVKSAVKRELRDRHIYSLNILEIDGQDVLFRTSVEAGTYIRTLCVDIGKKLGVNAHMHELRRTRAGPFKEDKTIILHDLKDAYMFWKESGEEKYLREIIKPIEFGVQHLKKVIIKDSAVSAIAHGAPLHIVGLVKFNKNISTDEIIAIMSLKGELVALGSAQMTSKDMEFKRKGVVSKTTRIIIKQDTYPKMWKTA
ncbi:MAG: RNA-guided pseudouridylation complex pseudouridine synthase subunit Cbf5 [DPANN group archaeon]|nr:RNA-guided pseudouridylation complex pseudouridine synthase subunit Cbf5 [DPANN group archaeon]